MMIWFEKKIQKDKSIWKPMWPASTNLGVIMGLQVDRVIIYPQIPDAADKECRIEGPQMPG